MVVFNSISIQGANMLLRSIALAVVLLISSGCSSGLSPRETRTQNYSAFIMSLYDSPLPANATTPRMVAPMKVAVAQIGELAPPQAMLEEMRKNPQIFSRAEGIPGLFEASYHGHQGGMLNH